MHRTSPTKRHCRSGKCKQLIKYIEVKIEIRQKEATEAFFQNKEDKTTEKELSEVEICNLSNKWFIKVMITKMFKELGKRFDEQNEKLKFFNKQKI